MAANHQWPSTCTDTQLSIVADALACRCFSAGVCRCPGGCQSGPAVQLTQYRGDGVEASPVQDSALPADVRRADLDDAVQLGLTGPALPVPAACPDIHVAIVIPAVLVMVLAGEHESKQVPPAAADQEHGPVLTLGMVLFVGNPGPHDFARFRLAVGGGGVLDIRGALEVARVFSAEAAGSGLRLL
ncbi:hypothetical protein D9M72_453290 [compost metagenome]